MFIKTFCKRSVACLLISFGFASFSSADLIISEILDGDLTGGTPKFVELTNTGNSTIDLSNYSIGNFNNGGTTLGGSGSEVLTGMLAAGDSYVISYENSDTPGSSQFFSVYGFDADNLELGAFINGDDAIALFDGPATGDGSDANIVDVYGVIGVNGDFEAWDYTDSYAFRNPNFTSGNITPGVFNPAEWTFGGRSALDGADGPGHVALTSPGTHAFNVVPEPTSSAMILGLVFAGLVRRKR